MQSPCGRCVFRCQTQHGDRVPENLGQAVNVFPNKFLRSYDEYVYHLDIFENAVFSSPIDEPELTKLLNAMHLRIDEAFLLGVGEEYLETMRIREDEE